MRSILLALILAGCAVPPASVYVSGAVSGRPAEAIDLGTNAAGEACTQAPDAQGFAEIYCGTWQQPSARVRAAGPADAAALARLAVESPWRSTLDATFVCAPPRAVNLGGNPAEQLDCTRRVGGWPHVAVAVLSGGQAWLGDGVLAALPAIDRSIAVMSGRATPRLVNSAAVNALQAQRAGEQARYSGDYRQYASLMAQGTNANLADEPAAAQSAFAAALALQEKQKGPNDPYVADPAMYLALQYSNQGRFAEAAALFARADRLVTKRQDDPTLVPRLLHYEALDLMNQHKPEQALALFRRAEAGYEQAVPADLLQQAPAASGRDLAGRVQAGFAIPLTDSVKLGLAGLVEVRRYEGIVLRDLHRNAESEAVLRSATELATRTGLEKPQLLSRLTRSRALTASSAGDEKFALSEMETSSTETARAYPSSRPLALILLLRANELATTGNPQAAIPICRSSIQVLRGLRSSGYEASRMAGCLQAFATVAAKMGEGADRQALLSDMFIASQLVRGSTTSQQIQLASARLAESSTNPKVAEAIRAQQDAAAEVARITRRREALADLVRGGTALAKDLTALDEEERAASATLAARESDLQAAAPNYGQLIQEAASATDVFRALAPNEAFSSIVMTPDQGWTFLLRDGVIRVGAVPGGSGRVDPLVTRIRAALTAETPAFDVAAAQSLYATLFGDLAGPMDGITALTVAPTGSLLSVPFSILLTGPADPAALGKAPWLVRRMAIGHVPSPGNFVALHRAAQGSGGSKPWFGFGDFRPVSLAQARRSFGPACGDSAEVLAHVPPLPSARVELAVAAKMLDASPNDELVGPAFTAPAVQRQPLEDYRILHFATHALLPSDLKCQGEPALIASPSPGAVDASSALLTASQLAQIKLNADLVILSACNSGGADGKTDNGESLSALARAFFYGGARALLITHWEVSDKAATLIIADTLRRTRADPGLGFAAALQGVETAILDRAGAALPAEFAHPFYWAPFALIGQASRPTAAGRTSASLQLPRG